MSATITNANLPPQFPLRLNTSDWAQLVPALAAKYPDRPMQVSARTPPGEHARRAAQLTIVLASILQLLLSPVAAPFVKSATTGMQGSMDFALGFSVVTNAGAVVPVFTFNTSLALGVDVHVRKRSAPGPLSLRALCAHVFAMLQALQAKMVNNTPALILDITKLTLTMGVTKSEIGTINLAPIQVRAARMRCSVLQYLHDDFCLSVFLVDARRSHCSTPSCRLSRTYSTLCWPRGSRYRRLTACLWSAHKSISVPDSWQSRPTSRSLPARRFK